MKELYADIAVPVARDSFTFLVEEELRGTISAGQFVTVQLGKRKHYTGVVIGIHGKKPPYGTIKTVGSISGTVPALSPLQLGFWKWLSEYYMCTLGEVMRAALPSFLRPEGFSGEEVAKRGYRPKKTTYIRLNPAVNSPDALNEKFDSLKRAKKQYEALIDFTSLGGEKPFGVELPRSALAANGAVLKALEKKGVLETVEREAAYGGGAYCLSRPLPILTPAQSEALESARKQFSAKNTVLLHGITGSGKTEIYMHLIDEQLQAGKSVLYLMPEIAMTSQMTERIGERFGEKIITYHSHKSDRHRLQSYLRAAGSEGGELALGARSAVFLPLKNLGLVIIDEEHDSSFKQAENAPRFNARDCAVMLAGMAGAKTILGSATPSAESYANSAEGKYGYVRLTERYGGTALPRIVISDTSKAVKRGERTAHFNRVVLDRIAAVLDEGRQVMLFQNRRGYSPYMECRECGHVAFCRRCNVSLTFHKKDNLLRCHYCGYSEPPPAACPECRQGTMRTAGFGTEKVEEELRRLFPQARQARLDRDTAKSAGRTDSIVSSFRDGGTDLLVGTQMITKSFDFGGVSLAVVLNADNLLNFPDFRASERAFQTIMQAAGRAGRRQQEGTVVIQTSQPNHKIIEYAAGWDYEGMIADQLSERRTFDYPPYCRLVSVTLRHRNPDLLGRAAGAFAERGRTIFGSRLLGPHPPAVDRIKNEYLLAFLLKSDRGRAHAQAKSELRALADELLSDRTFKAIRVSYDVDPQ